MLKVPMKAKATRGDTVLSLRAIGKDAKLDPFAVGDTVSEAIGYKAKATVDNVGRYTIRVRTTEQANKLTRIRKLNNGEKVRFERHASLNVAKCIIQHPLITDTNDETLATKLRDQGVVKVRSINPDRRLKIVHIEGTKVPQHIMIGLIKCRTQKYYNMPKTCRKCMRIGHITENCAGEARCGGCSGLHTGTCNKDPHCINCGDNHPPLSKTCPLYQQEKAIIRLQTDNDIPPKKARKAYMAKAKGRYLPLPTEGNLNEDPSSEDEIEEVNTEDSTEDSTRLESGEGEASTSGSKAATQKTNRRKPKARRTSGRRMSAKRRKEENNNEEDEVDDFILQAELDLIRKRQEELGLLNDDEDP